MFILLIQSSLRRQSVFYLYLHATLCHKIANNAAIKMFSSGAYVCGSHFRKKIEGGGGGWRLKNSKTSAICKNFKNFRKIPKFPYLEKNHQHFSIFLKIDQKHALNIVKKLMPGRVAFKPPHPLPTPCSVWYD